MTGGCYSIYEVLDKIRHKPAMYLGVKSITRLQAYLYGYDHAMQDQGLKEASEPKFFGPEFFHDWTARRLCYSESTAGCYNLILADVLGWSPTRIHWEGLATSVKPADEASAFDLFYILLDEYRCGQ